MHYQHFRNDSIPTISTASRESGRPVRSRKFPLIWLDQYTWMQYDTVSEVSVIAGQFYGTIYHKMFEQHAP